MNKDEYNEALNKLTEQYEANKKQLAYKCAISNNHHKVGDVITGDTGTTIKINKITWSYGFHDIPYCIYYGEVLNKDGTPNKKGKMFSITQARIKTETV